MPHLSMSLHGITTKITNILYRLITIQFDDDISPLWMAVWCQDEGFVRREYHTIRCLSLSRSSGSLFDDGLADSFAQMFVDGPARSEAPDALWVSFSAGDIPTVASGRPDRPAIQDIRAM